MILSQTTSTMIMETALLKQQLIDSSTLSLGQPTAAAILFSSVIKRYENLVEETSQREERSGQWPSRLEQAAKDLADWSKRGTAYQNAEEIALAALRGEVAHQFEKEYQRVLLTIDGIHAALIYDALETSGLFRRMQEEGAKGRMFALEELEGRLGPGLTKFKGSSQFYEGCMNPYSARLRAAWEERIADKIVSSEQAKNMIENLGAKSGAFYLLAETSAAPAEKPPRSGEKPRLIVCRKNGGEEAVVETQIIETPLRLFFTASVREIMYHHLHRLYAP